MGDQGRCATGGVAWEEDSAPLPIGGGSGEGCDFDLKMATSVTFWALFLQFSCLIMQRNSAFGLRKLWLHALLLRLP